MLRIQLTRTPILLLALCTAMALACSSNSRAPLAYSGVLAGGSGVSILEAEAAQALVYVQSWAIGEDKSAPGTAFVVAQDGEHAYLLSALHVFVPVQETAPQIARVRLRGGCVAELDTNQPEQLVVASDAAQDIALLRVKRTGDCKVVRLSSLIQERAPRLVAYGYAPEQDTGPLPTPDSVRGALTRAKRDGRDVFTTGAALKPGMSGGPVLVNGLVVGVVRGRVRTGSTEENLVTPVAALTEALAQHTGLKLLPQRPPQGLPPLPSPLIARPEVEAEIHAALFKSTDARRRPFVLLVGGGGTGKTVLATKVALDSFTKDGQRFEDGVFFVEVKDREEEAVLQELAQRVFGGAVPKAGKDLAEQLRQHFDHRDALVILDDLRSKALPPLLIHAVGKQATVLATSRRRYSSPLLSQVVAVKDMPRPLAIKLLMQTAAKQGYILEEAQADRLAAELGDNALALQLAAGALAVHRIPYGDFVQRLQTSKLDPLLCTDEEEKKHCSQRATILVSWNALPKARQQALVALSLTADAPIPGAYAATLVGPGADKAIDGLVQVSLLNRDPSDGQCSLHPLLHSWGQEQAKKGFRDVQGEVHDRGLKKLLAMASTTTPHTWERAWGPHLEYAQAQVIAQGDLAEGGRLVALWNDVLNKAGEWSVLARMWSTLATAQQPPTRNLATALHNAGMYRQLLGDYQGALEQYRRSLAIFEELGDRAGMAQSYHQLGMVAHQRGDYEEALEQYRRSLAITEELGDRAGMAKSYHQLGNLSFLRGDYEGALEQYRRSLAITEELGDRAGMAKSYHQLGNISYLSGDYQGAREQYQRSLAIAEELGDRAGMAKSYHSLGNLSYSRGDYQGALEQYRRSLAIQEELRDRAGMAKSYHQLGMVAQNQGDYQGALEQYRRSLAIFEELGDRAGMAYSAGQLGIVAQQRGDTQGALEQYRRSLAIFEELGDRAGMAKSYHQLGMVAQNQGDYQEALEQYRRSLAIKEELGNRAGIALSEGQIGSLLAAQKHWQEAVPFSVRAWLTFAELQSPNATIVAAHLKAQAAALGPAAFRALVAEAASPEVADAILEALSQEEGD